MKILRDLRQKLETKPNALELFRSTCFGVWLDINEVNGDPLLVHTIIGCQIPSRVERQELLYKVYNTMLCFNKHAFCLITGFLCGNEVPLPPDSPTTLIPRIFGNFKKIIFEFNYYKLLILLFKLLIIFFKFKYYKRFFSKLYFKNN